MLPFEEIFAVDEFEKTINEAYTPSSHRDTVSDTSTPSTNPTDKPEDILEIYTSTEKKKKEAIAFLQKNKSLDEWRSKISQAIINHPNPMGIVYAFLEIKTYPAIMVPPSIEKIMLAHPNPHHYIMAFFTANHYLPSMTYTSTTTEPYQHAFYKQLPHYNNPLPFAHAYIVMNTLIQANLSLKNSSLQKFSKIKENVAILFEIVRKNKEIGQDLSHLYSWENLERIAKHPYPEDLQAAIGLIETHHILRDKKIFEKMIINQTPVRFAYIAILLKINEKNRCNTSLGNQSQRQTLDPYILWKNYNEELQNTKNVTGAKRTLDNR